MADWKKQYASLAKAHEELIGRFNVLASDYNFMYAQKKQWEVEKVKQSEIISKMIQFQNTRHEQLLQENQRLTDALREARNGNNH